MRTPLACLLIAAVSTVALPAIGIAEEPATQPSTQPATKPVDPKALSTNVTKGLDWLVKSQLKDGGWGQGDESNNMGGAGALSGVSNVADTCMSVMALMRSGSTPTTGPYATNIRLGVEFICSKIEASDNDSLYITDVRGTRVQSKIGTYVDTFLATQVLSDVKGHMGGDEANNRVSTLLARTIRKIEINQNKDGTFAQQGWATTLSGGIASKAMNQAAVRGERVNAENLKRFDDLAKREYDEKSGSVVTGGSAGVDLYGVAANSSSFANADLRMSKQQLELEKLAASPSTQPEARAKAQQDLVQLRADRAEAAQAQDAAIGKMNDPRFVSGFGSNGGEEFLSYLNIGEAMVLRGDVKFGEWDQKMTENLNRVQNDDGSWSGHHCITGKNFCTASALIVLMVDRTQSPMTDPLKKRQ